MGGPGATTLLFVPTPLEARELAALGGWPDGLALVELAGFGPIAAAARAAERLSALRPRRALLVGIAGALDAERCRVGQAYVFERVHVDGIGAGSGASFRSAEELSFAQWAGGQRSPRIDGTLPLAVPTSLQDDESSRERTVRTLLTVCSASASPDEREERARRYAAAAEDMEAFAVALAARLAGVPLAVVRGISNLAGDRDPRHWSLAAALSSARKLAIAVLESEQPWRVPGPAPGSAPGASPGTGHGARA